MFGDVVSWHPSVALSFPLSQQEEEWVTFTEWKFSTKPRELREFNWSLGIRLRTVRVCWKVCCFRIIPGCNFSERTKKSAEQLWIWKSVVRILSVWAQGMLEKNWCDFLHVKLPQAFQLQSSLMDRGAHPPLHCELLSIVSKTGMDRDTFTNIYIK